MQTALMLLALAQGTPGEEPANLDFTAGRLTHWTGDGFRLVPGAGGRLPTITSAPTGKEGRSALLHRTFTVPSNARWLRGHAAAVRPADADARGLLDVFVEATGRRLVPKQVRTKEGWRPAATLLDSQDGTQHEYQWDLGDLAGQPVRIVLVDQDDSAGRHVVASGFRLVPRDDPAGRDFVDAMLKLSREHLLGSMSRLESRHFLAIGNADEAFIEQRLANCEAIHALFFRHFRDRGFSVREPRDKLMVAIFDTQSGLEAYLGQRVSSSVTGIYHPPTNRLVVYDYAGNRSFQQTRERNRQRAAEIPSLVDRQLIAGSMNRRANDFRNDLNIGTILHEAAHQLAFNGGLLNRDGDHALWLVEGMACYCEPTSEGGWQGLGAPNPLRAQALAQALQERGSLWTVRQLAESDSWLRDDRRVQRIVLGYAQSWALFRMLMEERPADLRRYLKLIHDRRTPDHRLTDFAECFGPPEKLQPRYAAYLRAVAAQAKADARR